MRWKESKKVVGEVKCRISIHKINNYNRLPSVVFCYFFQRQTDGQRQTGRQRGIKGAVLMEQKRQSTT